MQDQRENNHYIRVNLLDELPWASSHWSHVKLRRATEQVRQSSDRSFRERLTSVAKRKFDRQAKLPLMSTGVVEEAYKKIWRWYTSKNIEHVDLDRLILCPTNALVDEHNKQGISSFPR